MTKVIISENEESEICGVAIKRPKIIRDLKNLLCSLGHQCSFHHEGVFVVFPSLAGALWLQVVFNCDGYCLIKTSRGVECHLQAESGEELYVKMRRLNLFNVKVLDRVRA